VSTLRERIADAIRKGAYEQTYYVPGPIVAGVYADAVLARIADMTNKEKTELMRELWRVRWVPGEQAPRA